MPIDIHSYLVSGGNADHVVEEADGELRCGCMDATVRGSGCKHELCVRLNAGDPGVVKALRGIVPNPPGAKTRTLPKEPRPGLIQELLRGP